MTVLAHGTGFRDDLPIPFFYAFAAALAALFVSFLGLAVLWPASRLRGSAAGRPIPGVERVVDSRAVRTALRLVGLVAFGYVVWAAAFVPAEDSPVPALVYVVFWVGLVPASLLFGPVWRVVNPLRTIHLLLDRLAPRTYRSLPARIGYWPAAAGLFAFTWMELVAPEPSSATTLLTFVVTYAVTHVACARIYGLCWFERCDAFETYSALLGQLAFVGRRADGRLVVRSPFNGLDGIREGPGLVATVCVLLGSTAYDSISGAPAWVGLAQSASAGPTVVGTLGLLCTIALVATLYLLCARFGASLAHSLVPIIAGYLIAHYFSLLLIEGQRAVVLTFGLGIEVNDQVVAPATIAAVQVAAIVTGHVLGVVAAHDRVVRLAPPERAVSVQIPMFLLMVFYTLGGLTLLLVT